MQPLSLRGVPLLLMKPAPADATNAFRVGSQRFKQTSSKQSKRGELWNMLALAKPEKYRLAGKKLYLFIF